MAEYDVPARDPVRLAGAVQRWVQKHIKFVRETPETYVAPARTLKWKIGDCDDMTILICATLRGARIPMRAVFAGWEKDRRTRPTFRHVYPQAHVGGEWRSLEAVRPVPLGWDIATHKRAKGYRVRRGAIGDRPDA